MEHTYSWTRSFVTHHLGRPNFSDNVSSLSNPEFRPGGLRSDNVSTDRSEQEWRLIALDKRTGKIAGSELHTAEFRAGSGI